MKTYKKINHYIDGVEHRHVPSWYITSPLSCAPEDRVIKGKTKWLRAFIEKSYLMCCEKFYDR